MSYYLAVDLGASSGRCILGWLEDGLIRLEEVHRFKNETKLRIGQLCWDTDELFRQILAGMRRCGALGKAPVSVGIDTWGVDFVLLDGAGRRLGDAVSYRDRRTEGMSEQVSRLVNGDELYRRTGVGAQDYNTIYQLTALAKRQPDLLVGAERFLMIPDYFHYLLSGVAANEYTEASTTGLMDAHARQWDRALIQTLGLPERLFALPLTEPGTALGTLSDAVARTVGYDCKVVLPASHDTGSAFLSVPAVGAPSVYISSGTWSLLGVETTAPVTTPESCAAGFTNEGGYQSRHRYLKNIMGLWMLQRLRAEQGEDLTFRALSRMAEASPCTALVDVGDGRFFAPASMTEAVRTVCRETGQEVPRNLGDVAKCVYRSLAKSYAAGIRQLEGLTGQRYEAVHIVGGGSQDEYLNRLTAAEAGLPLHAGPTEGSALGNLMVQMISSGVFSDLSEARAAVRRGFPIKTFAP